MSKEEEFRGDNSALIYRNNYYYDRFGNLYRKTGDNPTTGQQNPLSYTPIEDGDINKSKNQFASGTTYDDAGNVITDNKFRQMSFTYDGNGRRIKATATNQDASTVYDAHGNRVAARSYDLWRYMIYDAFGKLVAEYGISSQSTGGVQYVQQDWQGSVRTVVNAGGFVTSRTDYQAFGEEIGEGVGLRSVGQGYSGGKAARQGYGLTEEDEATGQQHTWFRKLETQAGRWTSPDPYKGSMEIGNPQSFNRYSYVGNDPINFVDPSGLDDEEPFIIIDVRGSPWDPMDALRALYLGGLSDNPISPVDGGVPIEPGGGGPIEPGGGVSPLPFNSCAQFVDWLVNSLNDSLSKNKGELDNNAIASYIGNGLMHLAFFGYNRHIDNRFDGFKDKLVKPGKQGAGVYGHILFHAGANLAGPTQVAGYAAHLWDVAQDKLSPYWIGRLSPPLKLIGLAGKNDGQGPAEIDGNIAGRDVGNLLWGAIKTTSIRNRNVTGSAQDKLRKNLTSKLCK